MGFLFKKISGNMCLLTCLLLLHSLLVYIQLESSILIMYIPCFSHHCPMVSLIYGHHTWEHGFVFSMHWQ